jgi:hypothetical protein
MMVRTPLHTSPHPYSAEMDDTHPEVSQRTHGVLLFRMCGDGWYSSIVALRHVLKPQLFVAPSFVSRMCYLCFFSKPFFSLCFRHRLVHFSIHWNYTANCASLHTIVGFTCVLSSQILELQCRCRLLRFDSAKCVLAIVIVMLLCVLSCNLSPLFYGEEV